MNSRSELDENQSNGNVDIKIESPTEDLLKPTNDSQYECNFVLQADVELELSSHSHQDYDTNYVLPDEGELASSNQSHQSCDYNYELDGDFATGDNARYDENYKGTSNKNA